MPLRYLLDEHLRGILWRAVRRHNIAGIEPIDVTRIGDPPDLPLGTPDADILLWVERESRILVSWDASSMPGYLANHLRAGHHSPGVFVIRKRVALPHVVDFLVYAAYQSDATD
jgi:hypothetical protein